MTTDIGWAYAAQMKAVLAGFPTARPVIDLTHDIAPQSVREAAFLLRAMAERFPPGAVHVCVVDPGVGGRRAPVAVECANGSYLVGPDNGVLYPLAVRLGLRRAVRLDRARVELPHRVGATFDGRDLFAPAAGRLAGGATLRSLGEAWTLRRFELPVPLALGNGWTGEILHKDRFGNLITNLPSEELRRAPGTLRVTLGGKRLGPLPFARTYESLGKGVLGLLPSSFGWIELSVGHGNAGARTRAGVGTPIRIGWTGRRGSDGPGPFRGKCGCRDLNPGR
ncbi:protein containing DUF62 [mine drainage metagenome]|uniref:Protein containing DUF62 n=3 Tax=mine drainage metagenome TaxID=410659 RepID=T1BD25_9ZZZZ